jgi:hypothetical protein
VLVLGATGWCNGDVQTPWDTGGNAERVLPVSVERWLIHTAPTVNRAGTSIDLGELATERRRVSAGQRGFPTPALLAGIVDDSDLSLKNFVWDVRRALASSGKQNDVRKGRLETGRLTKRRSIKTQIPADPLSSQETEFTTDSGDMPKPRPLRILDGNENVVLTANAQNSLSEDCESKS